MIVNDRVTAYLDSLDPGNSAFLSALRREATENGVPIIRRDTEALLKTELSLLRPEEILELGTAVGYSALVMRDRMPEGSRITTIEDYAPRILAARENFRKAGAGEEILLLEGDAGQVIETLPEEHYGFIFMDAAKGQYLSWLPRLLKCLKENGLLFSDNVLQEGTITESRFAVDRRDRTIHARMREYLFVLTHTEGLITSVVPVGDGAALTVKGKAFHEIKT